MPLLRRRRYTGRHTCKGTTPPPARPARTPEPAPALFVRKCMRCDRPGPDLPNWDAGQITGWTHAECPKDTR